MLLDGFTSRPTQSPSYWLRARDCLDQTTPDTRHASWETVAPAARPRMLTDGVGPSTSTLLSAVSTSMVEKQRGTQGISNQSTFLHASRAVCWTGAERPFIIIIAISYWQMGTVVGDATVQFMWVSIGLAEIAIPPLLVFVASMFDCNPRKFGLHTKPAWMIFIFIHCPFLVNFTHIFLD